MIDQNSIITSDMKIKHVPPHKYGVFKYMGPHSASEISSKYLSKIWKFIFDTWMPTVEFDLKQGFDFEYINLARCNKNYCACDLYYPISAL